MSNLDLVSDHSKEKLVSVPRDVLDMSNLKMLFLEGNFLTELPDTIFEKLPRLMWLDLRNNLLEWIPTTIAYHKCLENLLLTNNSLRRLPNELGLVPKLRALQVAENPLEYPPKKVVVEGTKAIKRFLKSQYEEEHPKHTPIEEEEEKSPKNSDTEEESSAYKVNISQGCKPKTLSVKEVKKIVKKNIIDPLELQPTLNVTQLQNPILMAKVKERPIKIVHNVKKEGSKIALKSYFHRIGDKGNSAEKVDPAVKQGWLDQLRILLNDQERILQQERNLRVLSEWRLKKQESPGEFSDEEVRLRAPAPYGTWDEFNKMPTRRQLATQLAESLKRRGVATRSRSSNNNPNMDRLINDVIAELKKIEDAKRDYVEKSPRTEMDNAERQMRAIMDIQKKLMQLKVASASTI